MRPFRHLLLIACLLAGCAFDPGGLAVGDDAGHGGPADAAQPVFDAAVPPGALDARPDAPPPPENCHNGTDDDLDGQIDCQDGDCAGCDDGQACTEDSCTGAGACVSMPINGNCGDGCQCDNGGATEHDCSDGADNDDDGSFDCGDDDCGGCFITDTCCGDGVCRLICF